MPVAQTSFLFHLIFFSFNPQADPTKAVITLKPPWVSVFQEENVTLLCEGPHRPGDTTTQWFLNGTALKTLAPRYSINSATFDDSGEYKCQTGLSILSDPVQLEIHSGKYAWNRRARNHKVFIGVFSFLDAVCVCVCVCVCVPIYLSMRLSSMCLPGKSQDTQNITLGFLNCAPTPHLGQLFSSVQFSHSVMSDSLRPHESQHARPPCPSPTPRVHPDSRPSSQ